MVPGCFFMGFHGFFKVPGQVLWFLKVPGWFSSFFMVPGCFFMVVMLFMVTDWFGDGLGFLFQAHPLLSMMRRISTRMVRRISTRMVRNAKPGCRRTVSWASATLCGNPPPWPSPTASPASTYLSNLPFFPTIFSSLGFVWPLFFFSTSRFLVNHLASAPLWSFVTIKPRPLS